MLQVNFKLAELRDLVRSIPEKKDRIFDLMRMDTKEYAKDFLNTLMACEFDLFLGRDHYARQLVAVQERNYRNGHYVRSFAIKGIGKIQMRIPRDRKGRYQTSLLKRYSRVEGAIQEDAALLYLLGTSTRNLSLISKRLFGVKMSAEQVSNCSGRVTAAVETWRTRPITETIKYLYIDGTNFTMRVGKEIQKVNVLVVIGVDDKNIKHVIALQAGDKESASNWRELFIDLKKRGLKKDSIQLGMMDGLAGLEKVFTEEFPKAVIQRCQVHVARNVLAKVPHKQKQAVADDMKSIFYASDKSKSLEFFKQFKTRWGKVAESATKCLESSIKETLTFYGFPQDEWRALRTTNPIERLNKEFKRRTDSMEIVAGERSCYNLLATIALKMELYWQRHPLQRALPWLEGNDEFTQNI